MSKENVKKAEYPLNSLGMGFRTTVESGPYLFTDVRYIEPKDNYRGQFCGACAFFGDGNGCVALQNKVDLLGSCKLYIPMEWELTLRHEAYMRRVASQQEMNAEAVGKSEGEGLEIRQQINKYIQQRGDKWCIISHETGKNLGCYSSKEKAEAALERMKRFRKDIVVKIASVQEDQQVVIGEVLVPDTPDAHDDTITAEEIEKAAHNYALTPMVIGQGHLKEAKARPVETYIYDPEVVKGVKPGSWIMAVKIEDDELWEGIKKGEFTGFSIGAMARRISLEEEDQ